MIDKVRLIKEFGVCRMNRKIAILLVSAVLAACGDSSDVVINEVVPPPEPPAESRVVFNIVTGDLPLPNDLLFAGTTDGTLQPPDEVAATSIGEEPDLSNPAAAIGGVDGWSTQFPMVVNIDLLPGAALDPATVNGSTVLMFKAITPPIGDSPDLCQIPNVPAGQPCGVDMQLQFGVEYVAVPGGGSIAIAPIGPLDPSTTYLVAFVPGIMDDTGTPVAASEFYEIVTQASDDVDIGGDLGAVQDVINLYEAVVAIGTGGNPFAADDLIYSAAWTTASVGVELATATSILAASPPSITSVDNIGGSPVPVTVEDTLIGAGLLDPSMDGLTGLDNALLMQAEIVLPYYSGTPADGSDPITDPWVAQCDNALATAAAIAAELPPVEPNNTVCSTINPDLGDFGVDSQRFVTQFNPVPLVRDLPTIEVQITVPASGSDWPVVILQHGITSQREDLLLLAGALSANGFATFAIDHPLHGSRGLTSAALGGIEANATTNAVTDYLNLAFLLNGRSNLLQSMADLLGLRMAIGNEISGALTSADFDTANVQFVGQSLGAMSGLGFVQLANTLDLALPADLAVGRAALASPGGGIFPFLLDSPSFGELIIGTVLAGAGLTTADPVELQTATLLAFAFAAQTVIDGSDPSNFAPGLAALGTPVYMSEIVGGETVNDLPDQVIPNQSSFGGLTFGGTEPLAAFLGLENVNGANSGAESGIVRFDQGSHGSLLNGDVATAEMQAQVISFLSDLGIVVGLESPEVILGQ